MDDLHQWQHQGIGVGVVNNSNTNNKSNTNNNKAMEKKLLAKPANKDEALNCPRCASTNTKFCYYNNYSLSQPRYFCKTCRRYWTQGGSLRNVPVGGGSRKNRRPSLSSSSSSPSVIKKHNITNNNSLPDQHDHHHLVSPLPIANLSFLASSNSAHHDLNLAYPSSSSPPTNDHHHHQNIISKGLSLMSGGSPSNFTYPSSTGGFTNLLEFKPPSNSLNFSVHNGFEGGGGYGSFQLGLQEGGGGARVLFPVEDLKPMPNTGGQNGDSNGYWNAGMLGGGSW